VLYDRPEKWNWVHRDADGNGLLVGPNCPDCLRREVARYRCTACTETWEIPGVYHWSWQGKGHWHRADDESAWDAAVSAHVAGHGLGRAMIVPESRKPPA
jgi:hypothetical protein